MTHTLIAFAIWLAFVLVGLGYLLSHLYHKWKLRAYCATHGHIWVRDFCDDLFCLRCGEDAQ